LFEEWLQTRDVPKQILKSERRNCERRKWI